MDIIAHAQKRGLDVTAINLRFDGADYLLGAFTHPLPATRAKAIATAIDGRRFVQEPASSARVVDSVGAGDAFLGTFSTALLQGEPLASCLGRAGAAGAIAVSRPGVYAALPSRDEVDRLLSERGR